MQKPLDSVRLFKLARAKAKSLKLPFDSFTEIGRNYNSDIVEVQPPEGRAMFFGFLFCECLYYDGKISLEAKNHHEHEIEAMFQEVVMQRKTAKQCYDSNVTRMQNALLQGRNDDAIEYAMNCLQCGQAPSIDFIAFLEHAKEKAKDYHPVPDDD